MSVKNLDSCWCQKSCNSRLQSLFLPASHRPALLSTQLRRQGILRSRTNPHSVARVLLSTILLGISLVLDLNSLTSLTKWARIDLPSMPAQRIAAVHLSFSSLTSGTSASWKITSIPPNPSTATTIGLQPNARKSWLLFGAHFSQAEWDVLTTTIDAQIPEEDKQNPAQWLAKLSQHYLGGEPIIQSTHNFLRVLKQAPGMSIQAWHTLVHLEYQKPSLPQQMTDCKGTSLLSV